MVATIDERAMISADTQQVSSILPDGDVAIMSLKNGVYYGLNPVGSRVWALIQKPVQVMDLINVLMSEYDVDRQQCAHDVNNLLSDLLENGLLTVEPVNQVAV